MQKYEFLYDLARDEVKLRVTIFRPFYPDTKFEIAAMGSLWDRAMAPLPKDHDLPFESHEQRTREQLLLRHDLCQALGRMFAEKLERSIASQDPCNGYCGQKGGERWK